MSVVLGNGLFNLGLPLLILPLDIMPHYSLLSKALVALSFTARLAAGNQVPVTDDAPFLCGNPPPTEAQLKSAEGFLEHERILRASALHTKRADIVVNTYFHVLANAETEAGGYLTVSAYPWTNPLLAPCLTHVYRLRPWMVSWSR